MIMGQPELGVRRGGGYLLPQHISRDIHNVDVSLFPEKIGVKSESGDF